MKRFIGLHIMMCCLICSFAQEPVHAPQQGDAGTGSPARRPWHHGSFSTDTPMVHDPVMACENGIYYMFSTGHGLQLMTSKDRKTWTMQRPVMRQLPGWTKDSVPGFRNHTWAPDIIHYRGRWWLAYSCSTFGRNTSAIGLASSPTLDFKDSLHYKWEDHGCLVASRAGRNNWNAIDPAFIVDDNGVPWLSWGSFWDGIQLIRLDTAMNVAPEAKPKTIARRVALRDTLDAEPNPTSKYAGRNAIEAPFMFRHGGFYYLFVSHDYCCRGMKSNYKVVVGRSRSVEGPFLDSSGRDMADGGGLLVIEGDKKEFEAAGHCAVYHFDDGDVFICHGYSTARDGQAVLVQRRIRWTDDGWPTLQ